MIQGSIGLLIIIAAGRFHEGCYLRILWYTNADAPLSWGTSNCQAVFHFIDHTIQTTPPLAWVSEQQLRASLLSISTLEHSMTSIHRWCLTSPWSGPPDQQIMMVCVCVMIHCFPCVYVYLISRCVHVVGCSVLWGNRSWPPQFILNQFTRIKRQSACK